MMKMISASCQAEVQFRQPRRQIFDARHQHRIAASKNPHSGIHGVRPQYHPETVDAAPPQSYCGAACILNKIERIWYVDVGWFAIRQDDNKLSEAAGVTDQLPSVTK